MKSRVVEDAEVVTYVVVCDPGGEAYSSLTHFSRDERLEAAQLTAVGGFERTTVGWFDPDVREYRHIPEDEQSTRQPENIIETVYEAMWQPQYDHPAHDG
jgi:hypothetical protein